MRKKNFVILYINSKGMTSLIIWLLVAAPAAVPAAAAGAVGIVATASVVVGRLPGAAEVASPPAGRSPVSAPIAVEVSTAAAVGAAAAAAGAVEASSGGLSRDQPLGDWLRADDPGLPGGGPFLGWRSAGWRAGCFSQHVIHHCGQLVSQDLVGCRSGVDWVLPPQLNDRVDVDSIVIEAKGVGGIENFHSLDPPHEDRVVDPEINIPDGLDHLVDVVVTVTVSQMGGIPAASGQRPHDDNPLTLGRLDKGRPP
jgi:hypothetical protein